MITDSIADCFTRLRNAAKARQEYVTIPYSKMKERILNLLKEEGFVSDCSVTEHANRRKYLVVQLKYERPNMPVLEHISRISKPGHRVYAAADAKTSVRGGLGFRILSTSKGIMTNRKAAEQKIGGEVIGEIW